MKQRKRFITPEGTLHCSKCGEYKQVTEFHVSTCHHVGYASQCKQCAAERHLRYYAENRAQRLEYVKQWAKENPEKRREITRRFKAQNPEKIKIYNKKAHQKTSLNKKLFAKLLGGKCSVCGYDKSTWALHFHHPGEKTISAAKVLQTYSVLPSKFQDELSACVLLCANCHIELHEQSYLTSREIA